MSLPPYPDYKGSGIAWLGDVPSHWDVVQTKRAFRRRKELNTGMICEDRLALTMNGVVPRSLDDLDGLQSSDYEGYQIFEAGDLAFKLIDLQNIKTSRVGMVPERGIMSPAYVRLEPASDIRGRFGYWYFMALYWLQVFNNLGGGVRQTLGPEELLSVPFPLPSEAEQTAIAAFLDRETAKIDALVAEQERLIALLREKRQAVISHAVTKGLNPDTPMKDSGIEWLGEVPAHWEVGPIKRFFQFLDGKRIPLSAEERGGRQGDYPYYGASGIIDYVDDYIFDESLVLVSEDGANLLMRNYRIAFVADGKYWVNNHAHILKPLDGLASFWADRIEAVDLTPVITGSAQPKLTADALEKLRLAVPPTVQERLAIEAFVLDATSKFAPLESEAQSAIALLQERRAALISAAVTGKIDVRGVVSQSNVVSIDIARQSNLPPLRAVVGAYTIRALGSMGRMAVMKGGYLAEAHVGVSELGGSYQRKAAGPYCSAVIDGMERDAALSFGIQTVEPVDQNGRVTYRLPQGFAAPSGPLKELIGEDRAARLIGLLDLLKDLSREGVEAAATLYAVWNDLLASSKAANDDAICNGVLNDWHPEKAKKFKRADLDHWLDWMRRNDLVPDGSAPRTDNQGSLFG